MRKAAVPTIRRATGPAAKEGRFYTVAGHCELFPSVTTILGVIDKPNLHRWTKLRILNYVRKRLDFLREESITTGRIEITEEWVEETIKEAELQPTVEAEEAAQFGTASHSIIENVIRGQLGTASHSIIENVIRGQEQEVDPKYAVVLENYNNWLAQSGLEIKETEKLIWSETYAHTIARAHTTRTRQAHDTTRHAHDTTRTQHSTQHTTRHGTTPPLMRSACRHGYAGSLDAWGLYAGQDGRQRVVVVDWKVRTRSSCVCICVCVCVCCVCRVSVAPACAIAASYYSSC